MNKAGLLIFVSGDSSNHDKRNPGTWRTVVAAAVARSMLKGRALAQRRIFIMIFMRFEIGRCQESQIVTMSRPAPFFHIFFPRCCVRIETGPKKKKKGC